ncbi:exported hypothetical protein [Verrucomicrobia bacterium]|nr:exported hypothetical protein [Verrucomicrobiota bacterium]
MSRLPKVGRSRRVDPAYLKIHLPFVILHNWLMVAVLLFGIGSAQALAADPPPGSPGTVSTVVPESNGGSFQLKPAASRAGEQDWTAKRRAKQMAAAQPAPERLPSLIRSGVASLIYAFIAALICGPLALILYLGRLALPPVMRKVAAPKPPPVEKDPDLLSFFNELWTGPPADAPGQSNLEDFGPVPAQMENLEALFSKINHCADAWACQELLADLAQALYALKLTCSTPGSRVLWQCASLLERLVKELSAKASEVTTSSLRTVAGGMDLLRTLSKSGELDDHLVTDPPVKLLAVDDNPVCLRAVSMALQNAFPALDLAADGAAALSLAQAWAYDAIFLDVEMPGLDGFELCQKIHHTAPNQKTPVIFITGHSDFDSRVEATICGGQELIGKPFLRMEIAFKSFALVTCRRLQKSREGRGLQPAAGQAPEGTTLQSAVPPGPDRNSDVNLNPLPPQAPNEDAPSPPSFPQDLAQAFFTHAPERLRSARFLLQILLQAPDEDARPQALASFRGDMQLLAAEAQRAGRDGAHGLAFAVQALLAKLLARPEYATDSCLSALTAALDLLDELCLPQANPDTGTAPLRFLVVDDDLVARRAIAAALQCNFGKPDIADSGETALALADQHPFDLIFMDVRMPGMDGFAACSAMRRTALNSETPVVFVTSQDDPQSRQQAALVQGSGFIVKPVLPSEIRLTALAFSLRSRLRKSLPTSLV